MFDSSHSTVHFLLYEIVTRNSRQKVKLQRNNIIFVDASAHKNVYHFATQKGHVVDKNGLRANLGSIYS